MNKEEKIGFGRRRKGEEANYNAFIMVWCTAPQFTMKVQLGGVYTRMYVVEQTTTTRDSFAHG
jgi:hypothetical protein